MRRNNRIKGVREQWRVKGEALAIGNYVSTTALGTEKNRQTKPIIHVTL